MPKIVLDVEPGHLGSADVKASYEEHLTGTVCGTMEWFRAVALTDAAGRIRVLEADVTI